MTMEYISRTYDVPAKRGMRVLVAATQRLGVITSSRGPHLMVRLLGHRNPRPYHPNDLKYDDESPLVMWTPAKYRMNAKHVTSPPPVQPERRTWGKIMGDSFGDFMIGEATRKTQEINQLGTKLTAAMRLVSKWREEAIGWPADSTRAALGRCADELESALTAPHSSSDPGRADTWREET